MKMTLKQFFAEGRLRRHTTNAREIGDLLRVVDRNLEDAAVERISVDLRFATAYQAALQLATIVLTASGFRSIGAGHHWVTFKVLPELLGSGFQDLADYFDQCRDKRNVLDYDRAGEIAETEAEELLQEARKFRTAVLAWLRQRHPRLVRR
ncbi:MAG: SAV_6107 family HEPN domain-containing protein [candidate division NC10 bacterium]